MTEQDKILLAMKRANPEIDGDLLRQIRQIDPTLEKRIETITRLMQAQR